MARQAENGGQKSGDGEQRAEEKVSGVRFQVSAVVMGKAHPTEFVWERFPTAIKIDRIPLFDVSRHYYNHGVIGRFTPWRDSTFISFLYRSNWTLAASGWADT